MVQESDHHHQNHHHHQPPVGLVVGNYCHDVLFRGGRLVGSSLGGAASFISNVLDPSLPSDSPFLYVSKVGPDFAYPLPRPPLSSPSSTTLFHAHFAGDDVSASAADRVLKRVRACDAILPLDLPSGPFELGVAAAVAGEIPPKTLADLLNLCRTVLVDVQGLIRAFDPVDGAVSLIPLRSTAFFELLPRIGFLKASAEEAPFVHVEEVRKWCCVIVTDGKDGCRIYWKDGEVRIPAFPAAEVDPTGAGDSFLGGFVVGLVNGLTVPDAALLGNFFGAITVGQIGVPKFDSRMMQKVKQELERKKVGSCHRNVAIDFHKSDMHEEFHAFLAEAAKLSCSHSATEQDDDEDGKHE